MLAARITSPIQLASRARRRDTSKGERRAPTRRPAPTTRHTQAQRPTRRGAARRAPSRPNPPTPKQGQKRAGLQLQP